MDNFRTDLKEYMPQAIAEIKQVKDSGEAIDIELDKLWYAAYKFQINQKIWSADEDGIKFYEGILHLIPGKNETLEERRLDCLIAWNNTIPYSENVLLTFLDSIFGEGGYDYTKDPTNSTFKIHAHPDNLKNVTKVRLQVRHMAPAHEDFAIDQETKATSDITLKFGGVCIPTETFKINTTDKIPATSIQSLMGPCKSIAVIYV